MDYAHTATIGFIGIGAACVVTAFVSGAFNDPESYSCESCSLKWQMNNYTGLVGVAFLATGLMIGLYL
jgi:hypothetical protein